MTNVELFTKKKRIKVFVGKKIEPIVNENSQEKKNLNIEYVEDMEQYIKDNNFVDAMEALKKIWQRTYNNGF